MTAPLAAGTALRRPSALAYTLLLITPALFGANMLTARWVGDSIPPVSLAAGRWLLTLLLLLPWTVARLWAWRAELRRHGGRYFALGALGMGICGPPVYLAGQTTTATNMGLIYAASPILILLIERVGWGRPIGRLALLGIGLCLAGVLAILAKGEPASLLALRLTPGDLWITFAMIGWALYSVLLRRWPSPLDLVTRFATITLGGVVSLLPFLLLELAIAGPPPAELRTLGAVGLLALVPGLGAFLAYGRLVAEIGPSRTGVLLYLIPVYNAGLAWVLLGERLQAFHLIGLFLILPGVWLSSRAPAAARSGARG